MHQKLIKLQSTDQNEKPPKAARLGFEVRATEVANDAHNKECNALCTATEEAKLQLESFMKQVILQVAGWEINAEKLK